MSAKPTHGDVELAPFLEDQILIVPSDHPWADGRTMTPADLLTTPFILRERAQALTRSGRRPRRPRDEHQPTPVGLFPGECRSDRDVRGGRDRCRLYFAAWPRRADRLGRVAEVTVQGLALKRAILWCAITARPPHHCQQRVLGVCL